MNHEWMSNEQEENLAKCHGIGKEILSLFERENIHSGQAIFVLGEIIHLIRNREPMVFSMWFPSWADSIFSEEIGG